MPETKKKWKIIKIVLLALLILFVVSGIGVGGLLISYALSAPPLDPATLETVEASHIIDREDREITQLHADENRIIIPIEEIPKHLQQAFIAIEDERFWKHRGIDILGLGRAFLVNIRERSFSQGASTITQQLIRNAMLEKEKRIKRKVQEMWLAIQLERKYSKKEILEMYLNRICFGHAVYGVEAAARFYLDKGVEELNLAESALLAGIVRLPEYDNPFYDEEGAVKRMKLVLGNMKRIGYISSAEYDEALLTELAFAEPTTFTYPYPYFIDYVVHYELVDILKDMPEFGSVESAYEAIYNGGFQVYTTLNTDYQVHLENVLDRPNFYPRTIYIDMPKLREALTANNGRLPPDYPSAYIDEENGVPQPQSALVLSDPSNGEVLALGGGREYSKNRNELLRYLSARQPGSAIKPVVAYCTAFEEGLLGAGSVLDDSPLIGPQGWRPENFGNVFRGMVTVRQALSWSYNIPAIRTYTEYTGLERGAEKAYRMGISTYNPRESTPVPSWTLGTREVTALDMAGAFGVFANNGVKMKTHTVRRIEDRNGRVIYEHTAEPEQVLSREATFITNSILLDVVNTTAAGLRGLGRPLAAKTGTADDERDVYLVAYTPNIVASFWMGYDIKDMGAIAGGANLRTWLVRELLQEVFKTLPKQDFPPQPPGVVRVEVCTKSGHLPTELCREAGTVRADYFLRNHVPQLPCDLHVQLDICEASGLLAGEFCPEDQVVQKIFLNRPEFIVTDGGWRAGAGRKPQDAEEMPPEETCDIHMEHAGVFHHFSASQIGAEQLALAWDYTGEDLKGFELYRAVIDGSGSEGQLIATPNRNQRSFVDRDVHVGSTYIYTIYALNKNDVRSEPSAVEVTVQEWLLEPPGSPQNLRASHEPGENGGFKISLAWEAADTRATAFKILRDNNELESIPAAPEKRSYDFTDNVEEPGTYNYTVKAYNSSTGKESAPANVEVVIAGPAGRAQNGRTYAWNFIEGLRSFLLACLSRPAVAQGRF